MMLSSDVAAGIRNLKAELRTSAGDPGDMDTTHEVVTEARVVGDSANTTSGEHEQKSVLPNVDFNCPVCTELLYKPVTTPCGHTFCKMCLDMSFSYKRQCPMCREPFLFSSAQVKTNVLLASIVEQVFPQAYSQRGLEAEKQTEQLREGRKKVIIGNTHELVRGINSSKNSHKWKFFVLVLNVNENLGDIASVPASYYIDKVDVMLHPTFTPSRLILTSEPFEIKRIGWGTFTIRGTIYFQPRFNLPPMAFEHILSFERNGTHRSFAVDFKSQQS